MYRHRVGTVNCETYTIGSRCTIKKRILTCDNSRKTILTCDKFTYDKFKTVKSGSSIVQIHYRILGLTLKYNFTRQKSVNF